MTTVHDIGTERKYLRRLRRASRWLPAAQADELYEQITAHLDEALGEQHDPAAAIALLAELGTPEELVRSAGGRPRRVGVRLRRVRRTTWVIAVVLAALFGIGFVVIAVPLIDEHSAAPLSAGGGEGFLYSDRQAARSIHAGSFSALEIDQRPGRQGFEFDILNDSGQAQKILGLGDGTVWGGEPTSYRLLVGIRNERGFPLTDTTFTDAPVTLRPGDERTVQVLWSLPCFHAPGRTSTLTSVALRVSVGPFHRIERIPLFTAFVLRSTAAC